MAVWHSIHRAGRGVAARRPLLLLAALLIAALGGCAPTRNQIAADRAISDYFAGNYPSAGNQIYPLAHKADEDFVLNNVRLGSIALADYNLDEAEAAFLRAYEVINSVKVNDGGRTLGAVLVSENIKIWKGEPYERAMANFYLGLVYYMRQDYNNARAAFENALFKLRDYGEGDDKSDRYREVESNFIIASLMLGKCWQKLDRPDLAQANFQRVAQLHPELAQLADYQRNLDSNLLLVVDYGHGPQKITEFDGSIVGFAPRPEEVGPTPPPEVRVDGRWIPLGPLGIPPIDLLALAQDRRWQSIDTIRTVKSAVGTGLIGVGAYQGLKRKPDYGSALALIGAGLLLKATSQADVRQWEMLPRTTFIVPLYLPPGTHDLTVQFPGLEGASQTWRDIVVPDKGEATYYLRMQRWNSGPFQWPPPALIHSRGDAAETPDPRQVIGRQPGLAQQNSER